MTGCFVNTLPKYLQLGLAIDAVMIICNDQLQPFVCTKTLNIKSVYVV